MAIRNFFLSVKGCSIVFKLVTTFGQPYEIRQMTVQDIGPLLELESDVWGSRACTDGNIHARINMFSEGQLVASLEDGQIIGYNGLQLVDSLWESNSSWAEITGDGTISTHAHHGQYLFGVSLTVHEHYSGIGAELLNAGQKLLSRHKKKGLFIGSRVPNFSKNSKEFSIKQWVYGQNLQSRDPVVAFFQHHGFKILHIIANYFEDPESCNYGVLMYNGTFKCHQLKD